jgi:hypothetical protein
MHPTPGLDFAICREPGVNHVRDHPLLGRLLLTIASFLWGKSRTVVLYVGRRCHGWSKWEVFRSPLSCTGA